MGAVVRRVYIVEGRVQGVGYRAHVVELAGRYPVVGSVRNLHDGTVRVEAQGEPTEVDRFLSDILRPRWPIHPHGVRLRQELPPDPSLTDFHAISSER
jgi:acylphosphatase